MLVLDGPDIPLHNIIAEQGLIDYVKKRKISGNTRNEAGGKCRDTFATLKKKHPESWGFHSGNTSTIGSEGPVEFLRCLTSFGGMP